MPTIIYWITQFSDYEDDISYGFETDFELAVKRAQTVAQARQPREIYSMWVEEWHVGEQHKHDEWKVDAQGLVLPRR